MSLQTAKIDWSTYSTLNALPTEPGTYRRGGKVGEGTLAGCVRAYFALSDQQKVGAIIAVDPGGIEGHGDLTTHEQIVTVAKRADFPREEER